MPRLSRRNMGLNVAREVAADIKKYALFLQAQTAIPICAGDHTKREEWMAYWTLGKCLRGGQLLTAKDMQGLREIVDPTCCKGAVCARIARLAAELEERSGAPGEAEWVEEMGELVQALLFSTEDDTAGISVATRASTKVECDVGAGKHLTSHPAWQKSSSKALRRQYRQLRKKRSIEVTRERRNPRRRARKEKRTYAAATDTREYSGGSETLEVPTSPSFSASTSSTSTSPLSVPTPSPSSSSSTPPSAPLTPVDVAGAMALCAIATTVGTKRPRSHDTGFAPDTAPTSPFPTKPPAKRRIHTSTPLEA